MCISLDVTKIMIKEKYFTLNLKVIVFVLCQGNDVIQAPAGVHVFVLCLLRGLALLPPSQPQQHLLCRNPVIKTHS